MEKTLMRNLFGIMLSALSLVSTVFAQTTAPQKPVRILLANGKLLTATEVPIHFKLLQVSLAAGQSTTYLGGHAMAYPISGALIVENEGETKTLQDGDGSYIEAGKSVVFKGATGRPVTFLEFMLTPNTDLRKSPNTKPAVVTELYESSEPIKGLKAGPYEFTMTRVVAPPKLPAPPMHHRSGAALYYVLSGSGLLRMVEKAEPRARGAIQYEPNDFIHSWQNAGDAPLILLQANISAEGAPEIIFLQ